MLILQFQGFRFRAYPEGGCDFDHYVPGPGWVLLTDGPVPRNVCAACVAARNAAWPHKVPLTVDDLAWTARAAS